MATVDSDKVVCGGIHAMIVAVLVFLEIGENIYFLDKRNGAEIGPKLSLIKSLFEIRLFIFQVMGVNVAGLVVLIVFYLVIFIVGVLAARRKKQNGGTSQMELSIVADRNISTFVGIFTMTGDYNVFQYINM
jgi:hypothetical protein